MKLMQLAWGDRQERRSLENGCNDSAFGGFDHRKTGLEPKSIDNRDE